MKKFFFNTFNFKAYYVSVIQKCFFFQIRLATFCIFKNWKIMKKLQKKGDFWFLKSPIYKFIYLLTRVSNLEPYAWCSNRKHTYLLVLIPTLCIWSMHIAQSSLTATPSFPSSFDTKTLTLSVKARGLIALVHLCPYRRSLPACLHGLTASTVWYMNWPCFRRNRYIFQAIIGNLFWDNWLKISCRKKTFIYINC